MDVKIAFLNVDIEEEICMKKTQGMTVTGQEHKLCKLLKSLDGLNKAPK